MPQINLNGLTASQIENMILSGQLEGWGGMNKNQLSVDAVDEVIPDIETEIDPRLTYGMTYPQAMTRVRAGDDGRPVQSEIADNFGKTLPSKLSPEEKLQYLIGRRNPSKGMRVPFTDKVKITPLQEAKLLAEKLEGYYATTGKPKGAGIAGVTTTNSEPVTLADLVTRNVTLPNKEKEKYLTDELIQSIDAFAGAGGSEEGRRARSLLSLLRQAQAAENYYRTGISSDGTPLSEDTMRFLESNLGKYQQQKQLALDGLSQMALTTYRTDAPMGNRVAITNLGGVMSEVEMARANQELADAIGAERNLRRIEEVKYPPGQKLTGFPEKRQEEILAEMILQGDAEQALKYPKSAFRQGAEDIEIVTDRYHVGRDGSLYQTPDAIEVRGVQADVDGGMQDANWDVLQKSNIPTNDYGLPYFNPEAEQLKKEFEYIAQEKKNFIAQYRQSGGVVTPQQQKRLEEYNQALAQINEEYKKVVHGLESPWLNPTRTVELVEDPVDGVKRVYTDNPKNVPMTESRTRVFDGPSNVKIQTEDGSYNPAAYIIGETLEAGGEPTNRQYASFNPLELAQLAAEQQGRTSRVDQSGGAYPVPNPGSRDAYTFDKPLPSGNHTRSKNPLQVRFTPEGEAFYAANLAKAQKKREWRTNRLAERVGQDYSLLPIETQHRLMDFDVKTDNLWEDITNQTDQDLRKNWQRWQVQRLIDRRAIAAPAVKATGLEQFPVNKESLPPGSYGPYSELQLTPEAAQQWNLSPEQLAQLAEEDMGVITPQDVVITNTPIEKVWDIPDQRERNYHASTVADYEIVDGQKVMKTVPGKNKKDPPMGYYYVDGEGIKNYIPDEQVIDSYPVEVAGYNNEGKIANATGMPVKTTDLSLGSNTGIRPDVKREVVYLPATSPARGELDNVMVDYDEPVMVGEDGKPINPTDPTKSVGRWIEDYQVSDRDIFEGDITKVRASDSPGNPMEYLADLTQRIDRANAQLRNDGYNYITPTGKVQEDDLAAIAEGEIRNPQLTKMRNALLDNHRALRQGIEAKSLATPIDRGNTDTTNLLRYQRTRGMGGSDGKPTKGISRNNKPSKDYKKAEVQAWLDWDQQVKLSPTLNPFDDPIINEIDQELGRLNTGVTLPLSHPGTAVIVAGEGSRADSPVPEPVARPKSTVREFGKIDNPALLVYEAGKEEPVQVTSGKSPIIVGEPNPLPGYYEKPDRILSPTEKRSLRMHQLAQAREQRLTELGQQYVRGKIGRILNPITEEIPLRGDGTDQRGTITPEYKRRVNKIVNATDYGRSPDREALPGKTFTREASKGPMAISNPRPSNSYERMQVEETKRYLSELDNWMRTQYKVEQPWSANKQLIHGDRIPVAKQIVSRGQQLLSQQPLVTRMEQDPAELERVAQALGQNRILGYTESDAPLNFAVMVDPNKTATIAGTTADEAASALAEATKKLSKRDKLKMAMKLL